eukprot:scaffold23.g4092.t1
MLSLFTSSLFIAGLFASLVASQVTRWYGRKGSGGGDAGSGAAVGGAAQQEGWLIVGRIFLGFGIGFANSSVPLYLSEMAPHDYRGAMNILFQLATTIGMAKEGRAVLERIRGTAEVDAEFDDISYAAESAKKISQPQAWKNILTKREYRPSLVLAIAIPTLQQWTGEGCAPPSCGNGGTMSRKFSSTERRALGVRDKLEAERGALGAKGAGDKAEEKEEKLEAEKYEG